MTNKMNSHHWQPSASFEVLKLRAAILAKIRAFFSARAVLEVDTPLLSHGTITDPYIQAMHSPFTPAGSRENITLYLQTSPEYAMKRLLAAGSGAIYQLCKAFRNGEAGRMHNPEFTILEWYRPDYDHHALMAEMDAFLQHVVQAPPAKKMSYAEIFLYYLDINPHTASTAELQTCANKSEIPVVPGIDNDDRNTWLDLLMSHIIEPHLGVTEPVFIYDYPITQAALARIRQDNPPVAERFEVYINGVELANGFHELADAQEQRVRFTKDLNARKALGYSEVPIDDNLLAALEHGFPNCAGVALGVDRLVMIAAQAKSIAEVLSFPIDRA